MDKDGGEGDDPSFLSPNEKSRTFRHPVRQFAKVGLREFFKSELGSSQRLQIERINFIYKRNNFCNYLPLNAQSTLRFLEFPAKIFPNRMTQPLCKIPFKIFKIQIQPRRRHARYPCKPGTFQRVKLAPIGFREVFKDDKYGF